MKSVLLGGRPLWALARQEITLRIEHAYQYLDVRYPLKKHHDAFPSLATAFQKTADQPLSDFEEKCLIDTFAHHERGRIPPEYIEALLTLSQQFRLGLVIDIWSPKIYWLEYFEKLDILTLFEAISFSSDHGHVKPSPYGFLQTLKTMRVDAQEAIFIGDSVRRDLGGARTARLDCVLVGGAHHELALDSFPNLLDLCAAWCL